MEKELLKDNFMDGIIKLRNIENKKPVKRTAGFLYLHNVTTKRMAKGQEFKLDNIDFSKFTYDDLTEYMSYYEKNVEPKLKLVSNFFSEINKAGSVFAPEKRYY